MLAVEGAVLAESKSGGRALKCVVVVFVVIGERGGVKRLGAAIFSFFTLAK